MIRYAASAALLVAFVPGAGTSNAQGEPDYTKGCTSSGCHDKYHEQTFVHGPIESGTCEVCHIARPNTPHSYKLIALGAKLCSSCHEPQVGSSRHPPYSQGNCLTCHEPHASNTKPLLRAESMQALCNQCHDDYSKTFKFMHGPAAAGACTVCHGAHATKHDGLLLAEGSELCVTCHESIGSSIKDDEHSHLPAAEDCTLCHDPHGANNRMNLTESLPDLCTGCHAEISEQAQEAKVKHAAMDSEQHCLSCHDPHSSNVEHLLTKEPMDLCLWCHRTEKGVLGPVKVSINDLLEKNPEHHGPIRQKNCTACHKEIHGGQHFRLLEKSYPSEFYTPFEQSKYALCFGCHEPDLVVQKNTEKLTNFRNGDVNLHYLHVNRELKGRTCRACHSTHASKRPGHVADSVPFGNWELPLNYKKTDTGGSCLPGCHKQYRYDREQAQVNIAP